MASVTDRDDKKRVKELLAELGLLDRRDFRPWSMAVLIVLVLGSGLAAILMPRTGDLTLDGRFLPSLIYGLISMVLLFNIYLLWQGATLRRARADLVRELLRADAAERLSLIDPLTGVFNRRYLDTALATEIKRSERSGNPVSLMILDLDDFGVVNKDLGHPEGDRLLCDVAHFMLQVFRQTDTVVRYGGDEFLVLMPETDEVAAMVAQGRFLRQLEAWNAEREDEVELQMSVGVAEILEGVDARAAIAMADERLRKSKIEKDAARPA